MNLSVQRGVRGCMGLYCEQAQLGPVAISHCFSPFTKLALLVQMLTLKSSLFIYFLNASA